LELVVRRDEHLDPLTEKALSDVLFAFAHAEACDCAGDCKHERKYRRLKNQLRWRVRQLVRTERTRCAAIARVFRDDYPFPVQRWSGRKIARRIEGKEAR
jgi:hypothetical protein